jgi:regulatory protein
VLEAELHKKLMNRAGRLLACRAYSRGELKQRLARLAGVTEVEAVLDRLEQVGILDDAAYARSTASFQMTQQGWGPIRVLHFLIRHQIAHSVAESAIEDVHQRVSDRTILGEYLERHFRKNEIPADRRGILKLVAHLRRRGFHDQTIYATLREIIPPASWRTYSMGE